MLQPRAQKSELCLPDYRAVFETLPGIALIASPDEPVYTLAAANRGAGEALRFDPASVIGRGVFEAIPELAEDPTLRRSLSQAVKTRKPVTAAVQAATRCWHVSQTPLLEQGQLHCIVIRLEEAGEQAAAPEEPDSIASRYGMAFARAPIGMVLLTPEGRIIEVNQAFLDTLGYTRKGLLERDSASYTHPEDVERTHNFFLDLRRGPHNSSSIEKRYLRSDGKILWGRATATMRRDANGKPLDVIAIVEDITDRKRAQELLFASQAQIRTIYDNTYQYIGLLSPDGILLECNRASLEFAGNQREDVVGQPFWETAWFSATPGAAEAVRQAIRQAAGGQFIRYEVCLRRPSGEEMTFDFSIHPLRNEDGEVIFLVPEARDITEQNVAASQINEDRRRWRELLWQAPSGIALLHGPEHRFDWVNPAYEKIVSRTAESLIGRPLREALPEIDLEPYLELLETVYRTGEPFFGHESLISLMRDGVRRDCYVNYVCLPTRDFAGVIDGIFVHATDVTDTVSARKQLVESEEQFRTLAETIPHLAWMADEAGNRFWYNRRFYDYTGTSLEDVKGWGWQKVHDPAVLPEVVKRWREALATGEPLEMIYPVRGADGAFRPFLTRVEPVKDRSGKVVRWFGTNTDIADQRKTEEELRRMNRELEEFAYVASHDLQEPMRMVNIYSQMILRHLDSDKETLNEYAGFVNEGVQRMEALIHDLLTFSRTVHRDAHAGGAAELSIALEEAMSVLSPRIEEAHATIRTGFLPQVRGETQQLAHVFQNILSNALKYRKTDVPLEIDISAERGTDHWTVHVRDNGIGFEPRYAERIFGLFKRLHKEQYPGTGLGLAICRRIVERYGGRMWAQGKPGEGATFSISLPFAAET